MPEQPLVSIIIPCRNEEKFIARCLDSIIANDYPKEKIEILIMDGRSEDKTREIIKSYVKHYPFIRLLDNPRKFTPLALNIGIKNAQGEIVIRMDSHSTYDIKYIINCVRYLNEYQADNVGGIWKIMPRENTLTAKAIAFASASIFTAGNAYYRRGYDKKPKWVDTVFGGCFRKEIFNKVGFFNENLVRSQDMEFNIRLKKAGGKILLAPEIISNYYPEATLEDFFKKNFKDGLWATYPFKFVKMPLSLRHYLPFIFVTVFIVLIVLSLFSSFFLICLEGMTIFYLLISFYFSAEIAIREGEWRYLILMPMAFSCRHFIYGLGSWWGIVRIILAD